MRKPPADYSSMTMEALREAVKDGGVTPKGRKKADFVAALTA